MPNTICGGSLAEIALPVVVATPFKQPATPAPAPVSRRSRSQQRNAALALIEGSLSARRVVRQAPWLAGLHRLADGTLLGLGVAMLGLSALTLHWQNQWGRNYRLLEATQTLEHRLQESAALLEQHHLGAVRRPGLLVPTSSDQLIHLAPVSPAPAPSEPFALRGIRTDLVAAGY